MGRTRTVVTPAATAAPVELPASTCRRAPGTTSSPIPAVRATTRAGPSVTAALALLAALLAAGTYAATVHWTGAAGDGRWSTAANWGGGSVPAGGDVAVLAGSADLWLDAASPGELQALVLAPDYTGTLRLERDLEVAGAVDIGGGTVEAAASAVRANGWRQSGGAFVGGSATLQIAGDALITGGLLGAPAALMRVERLEIRAPGVVRMAAHGKLELTGDGEPLLGDGLLDTSSNGPNSVEYTGRARADVTAATPMVALRGLRPGGHRMAGPAATPGAQAAAGLHPDERSTPTGLFSEAGILALKRGEANLMCAVVDPAEGFAYFGTDASPGVVVKVRLSDFTRVGALTLNPGEDYLESAVIDAIGGFAYFGTVTSPGIVVKVRLSDFTRVDALPLGPGEDSLGSAVIDPAGGFAYFARHYGTPGVVVKVRLSDFTRAGALTLAAGEDSLTSAVIDPAGGFAYFGTDTSPGVVVKVRLSDFTRVGAVTFNPEEGDLLFAVIDPTGGFAYFGAWTVGTVIKVRLSDLTRVGALALGPGERPLNCGVIDRDSGFAYFGTRSLPGIVVKVLLSDFTRVGALTLDSREGYLDSAVIDPAGGFAYFGTGTDPGIVVKVRLSDLTRAGTLTFDPGEDQLWSAVIDPEGGFAYFGTANTPGIVVKVRLSDFTRVGALTLAPGEGRFESAVIDPEGGFAYFGTDTAPGIVLKVRLSDFSRAGALPLASGESYVVSAVIDPDAGFAYFGALSAGTVVKVRLSDFTRVAALPVSSANELTAAAVIDAAAGFAYFGTNPLPHGGTSQPPAVVKVRLSDFTSVGTLKLSTGFRNLGTAVIDPAGGFAYFGTSFYPPSEEVIKVRLSDFTRVASLTFDSPAIKAAAIDPAGGFAYFGSISGDGAFVLKARLSDLTAACALTLSRDVRGSLYSAVLDPAGGYAYFGTSTNSAQVVRIDLGSTTTAVTASTSPSSSGQPVTFTATVSTLHACTWTPTGTVNFSSDGTPIAGCSGVPVGDGQAACTTSSLAPGSHVIGAAFSADASWSNSRGETSHAVIPPAAPVITSADHATFTVETHSVLTVTSTGSPTPALSVRGALPSGVTFTDNGNGTGALAGTPIPGTAGVYALVLVAHNGVGADATQELALSVNPYRLRRRVSR